MSFGSLPSVLGNGGGVAISVIGGTGLFADGTAAAPSISFAADSDTGFYRRSDNAIGFAIGGVAQGYMVTSGSAWRIANGISSATRLDLFDNGAITLTASGTNQNITLTPSGTGVTVAGGATNYLTLDSSSVNPSLLFTNANGTLTLGALGSVAGCLRTTARFLIGNVVSDSGALLQIGTNTTNGAGGIVFGTDTFLYRITTGFLSVGNGTVDGGLLINVGAANNAQFIMQRNSVGFFRVLQDGAGGAIIGTGSSYTAALTLDASQNATFAGSIGLAAAGNLSWTSRSIINSPADSVLTLYNSTGSNFDRLQFGGTSASFPGLRRSGTTLEVILANASAYATIAAATHVSNGAAVTVGAGNVSYGGTTATTVGAAGGASLLPATPLGYIIVNVAGTAAKIPYYNS